MQPDVAVPPPAGMLPAETIAPNQPVAPRKRGIVPAWVRTLVSSPLAVVGVVLFFVIVIMALIGPLIARYAPLDMVGPLGSRPTSTHWLGTNDIGQELFRQIVY